MRLIALDFEFNQFFRFPHIRTGPDPKCPAEIIQVGAAKFDDALEITETIDFNVRPKIFKRLHPHVKRLTKISKEDLGVSLYFPDAFEKFEDFAGGEDAVFLIWGPDDMKELYRNILYYGLNGRRITKNYIDVQRIANAYLKNSNTAISLKAAAEAMELEAEDGRTFHNALSDALYTARIYQRIVRSEGFDAEPLPVQTVNLAQLKQLIIARINDINMKPLMNFAQNKLRRELTDRDREAVLSIYNAGRSGMFDHTKPGEAEADENKAGPEDSGE